MRGDEALNYLAKMCRCQGVTNPDDEVVPEIRREGKRILKEGAPVWVQLKRKLGTKKEAARVIECYINGTIKVVLTDHKEKPMFRVPADEFVRARNG